MQNLKFKIDKFYFILKFRLILLNFKYLSFININFQDLTRLIELFNLLDLTFLRVKSNKLTFLIKNNYFNNVLKHDYFLLYSNDFKLLSNKKLCKEINTLAFSGYFINNSYINKLEYYYNYICRFTFSYLVH